MEALLFDDLVSGGSWRKRFLGGIRADRGKEVELDSDADGRVERTWYGVSPTGMMPAVLEALDG